LLANGEDIFIPNVEMHFLERFRTWI